jgi:hypothetical protein
MKKALLTFSLLPTFAAAQSIAVVYDFKAKTASPVAIAYETRVVDDLFNIKWLDIDLVGFAGVSGRRNGPTRGIVGAALAWRYPIAKNIDFQVGIAGRLESGVPVATGVLVGLGVRF